MKKVRLILVIMCMLFSCTGCDIKEELPNMYIKEANLTDEELNAIALVGGDDIADKQAIYDFKVDDKIKAIQTNIYELKDAEWKKISGGSRVFGDIDGRIAISIDNIAKGCRIALQGENEKGSNSYITEINKEQENMGRGTSRLTSMEEIEYEKEIPLVIQVQTNKNGVSLYDVEYFNQPEEYEKLDYEYVYAVTIRFSEKSINELENIYGDID